MCSPPAALRGFLRTRGSASHPGIGLIPGTNSWPWSSSVYTIRRLDVAQKVLNPIRSTKQPQPIMRPVTLLTTNQAVAKQSMHQAMPTPLPSPLCLHPSIVKADVTGKWERDVFLRCLRAQLLTELLTKAPHHHSESKNSISGGVSDVGAAPALP